MTTSSDSSNASSTVGRGPHEQALAVREMLRSNAVEKIRSKRWREDGNRIFTLLTLRHSIV